MRRQLTQRRFLEARKPDAAEAEKRSPALNEDKTHIHPDDDVSAEQKSNFPAISLGKTSLVGTDSSEKPPVSAQKELDNILSSGSRTFVL